MTRENNRSVVAGGNVAINDIIYRAFHRYFPENGEETEMEFLSFAREGTTTDRPRGGDEKKKKKTKEHSRRTLVRDHRSIVEKKKPTNIERQTFLASSFEKRTNRSSKGGCLLFVIIQRIGIYGRNELLQRTISCRGRTVTQRQPGASWRGSHALAPRAVISLFFFSFFLVSLRLER